MVHHWHPVCTSLAFIWHQTLPVMTFPNQTCIVVPQTLPTHEPSTALTRVSRGIGGTLAGPSLGINVRSRLLRRPPAACQGARPFHSCECCVIHVEHRSRTPHVLYWRIWRSVAALLAITCKRAPHTTVYESYQLSWFWPGTLNCCNPCSFTKKISRGKKSYFLPSLIHLLNIFSCFE